MEPNETLKQNHLSLLTGRKEEIKTTIKKMLTDFRKEFPGYEISVDVVTTETKISSNGHILISEEVKVDVRLKD